MKTQSLIYGVSSVTNLSEVLENVFLAAGRMLGRLRKGLGSAALSASDWLVVLHLFTLINRSTRTLQIHLEPWRLQTSLRSTKVGVFADQNCYHAYQHSDIPLGSLPERIPHRMPYRRPPPDPVPHYLRARSQHTPTSIARCAQIADSMVSTIHVPGWRRNTATALLYTSAAIAPHPFGRR
jgi:hypothetical protein